MFRHFTDDELKLLQVMAISYLSELDIQMSFRVPGADEARRQTERFRAMIQVELDERASQKMQAL